MNDVIMVVAATATVVTTLVAAALYAIGRRKGYAAGYAVGEETGFLQGWDACAKGAQAEHAEVEQIKTQAYTLGCRETMQSVLTGLNEDGRRDALWQ